VFEYLQDVPGENHGGVAAARSISSSVVQMRVGLAATWASTSGVTHSGIPLVWLSSMRSVIWSALAIRLVTSTGSSAGSVSSSDSAPSSTCWSVTVARNVLRMLPARNRSCGRMATADATSPSPAAPDHAR
jgi:hypothetical protein